MNYGVYNTPYVNSTIVMGNNVPYYRQPMIVQPSPQVVVVGNGYNQYAANQIYAEDACLSCCCLSLLCCCLL